MDSFTPTGRTQVRRYPNRGVYDKAQVYGILDEGFLCHVGFAVDGQPFVIPTGYARSGDQLYIHGSAASRMLRTLHQGVDVCVTVTLVDAFVLARSGFHHSMNYRSVVVLGKARQVTDREEKLNALRSFTNHIVPGRWDEVRPPTDQELKATTVLALPLDEVSAKMRSGGPIDDDEDYALPIWAGIVPVRTQMGEPLADGRVPDGIPAPDRERFRR
ncbi:MAG TPA: pyridoxamine 5'-phosphate oxidase family protein [Bryobacteraceae bacterium]|nr:pyridoxamine 5'-phosphate oxidase family protein [Bryobacteraceae bacterium]